MVCMHFTALMGKRFDLGGSMLSSIIKRRSSSCLSGMFIGSFYVAGVSHGCADLAMYPNQKDKRIKGGRKEGGCRLGVLLRWTDVELTCWSHLSLKFAVPLWCLAPSTAQRSSGVGCVRCGGLCGFWRVPLHLAFVVV
jgi:hypothetical protein